MSNIKKKLLNHKRHEHIRFYEDEHEYYYYPSGDFRKTTERVQYKGITGWIARFCEKFNADEQAKKSNKNPNSEWYGMGEEAIKEAWAKKGKDARDKGSAIHKAIENNINTGTYDEEYAFYIDRFWEVMDEHNIEPLVSEIVVYDEDIERATPIDLMGIKDGKLIPMDIKSFEKGMEFIPYGGKTMKHPLGDLLETKFNKVSLQVSIVRKWLAEKYNLETEDGFVILLNDDGCQLFPVMDYIEKVNKMYEYV